MPVLMSFNEFIIINPAGEREPNADRPTLTAALFFPQAVQVAGVGVDPRHCGDPPHPNQQLRCAIHRLLAQDQHLLRGEGGSGNCGRDLPLGRRLR